MDPAADPDRPGSSGRNAAGAVLFRDLLFEPGTCAERHGRLPAADADLFRALAADEPVVPQPAQPDRLPSFAAGRRPVPVGRRRRLGPLGRLSGHADRQRAHGLCRRLAARQRALRRTGPALPVRRDRERADRAGGLSGLLRHFLLDRVHLQHTGRLLAGIHRIRGYGIAARRLARSVPDPRPGQRARSGQRLRLRPFSGRAVELYSHSRPADLHGHTVSLFREDRDRLVAAQRGNSLSRIRLHDHGARRAGEPDAVAAPPLRLVLSALRTDRPAGARDVLDRRAVSRAPVRLIVGSVRCV